MKDTIETLFSRTLTPSILNTNGNDLIRETLPHMPTFHINEHEIMQILSFRINFLNDTSLKGLLLPQTQSIVKMFVQQLLSNDGIVKTEALKIINCFEDIFKNEENTPEFYQRPLKPDNPLLYFHLSTVNYESYPYLALSFHRALRHVEQILKRNVENGSLPRKKAESRLQNIVIPFIHSIRFYRAAESDKLFAESPAYDKIKQALKRGQEDSSVRYHLDDVVDAYIRDVLAAVSGTYSPRSSQNITHVSWGRQIFYGEKYLEEIVTSPDGDEYSKALPTVVNVTFNEKTQLEAAEGAYPVEEAEEIFEAADNDLARILSLRQINPSCFQSHWSKQSIPLNTYSSLLHTAAKEIDAMTDEELAFLTFLAVLMFFGFAPKKTANIAIKAMPATEEGLHDNTIYCNPDGTCFFYRIAEDQVASIFAKKEDRHPGIYRDSGNIVAMTTGITNEILKSYLSRTQPYRGTRPFLFIFKNKSGKTQRFSLESFESTGKSLEEKFGAFPSAYAFSRSFVNYSVSRYHIDPIVSAYIANRESRELRAPIFYSNLTSKRLNEDITKMQANFLNDILRNAEKCGISFNGKILCSTGSDLGNENMGKVFFGSKFVPLMASMRETLNSIKDHIEGKRDQNLIARYNTFMFYNMLLWQLTCGFRQIEVERLDDSDIDAESGLIAICGKGNRLYTESRLIFIHPFTARSLKELILCRSAFIEHLINAGRYSPFETSEQLAATNIFSLANSRGQFIPASSDNVRQFLAASGIRFPYKLNSQRHLLRTFLLDREVKYNYLAAYFGHQTRGKEFLSYFSLNSLKEMRDAILPHIDELINELGLKIISYKQAANK